jgi:hypothetical protein
MKNVKTAKIAISKTIAQMLTVRKYFLRHGLASSNPHKILPIKAVILKPAAIISCPVTVLLSSISGIGIFVDGASKLSSNILNAERSTSDNR